MENRAVQEIVLTDDQVEKDCVRHSLALSTADEERIELTLDNYPPITVSRSKPISAQVIYNVFRFSPGAKYELHGLKSFGAMAEGVYTDFFSLLYYIVTGVNELEPESIVQLDDINA